MTTNERPFALPNAADERRVWFRDLIHSPRALPPLASDLNGMTIGSSPIGLEPRAVNGYTYSAPRVMGPPSELPELPAGAALLNWQTKYLPETRAAYELFRDADYANMSAAEILAFFDREIAGAATVFGNTILSAIEIGPEAHRLATLLESRLGETDGSLLAATILHGSGSQTRALGTEVAALADAARATPGIAESLLRHEFGTAVEHNGQPWAGALRAFLDDHADELALWSETHIPAWNEDPGSLLRLVAATLASPQRDRSDASAAAAAEARARLASEDQAEFEAALETSRNYVPVIEHRARWQLKLFGGMRRVFIEFGRKLVDADHMDNPNDVFFLHHAELGPASLGELDVRALVAERKAEHEANLRLEAPMSLGLPVPYEVIGAANP